jgi:hypothetical protein
MASRNTIEILWQCVDELRALRGAPPLSLSERLPRPKLRVIEGGGGETWVRDPADEEEDS